MKVLQLNVWTGRMKGALTRFLRENRFDLICLQEAVWSENGGEELAFFVDTVDRLKEAAGLKYETRACCWEFQLFGDVMVKQGNVILSRLPIVKDENILIGPYNNVGISKRMGSAPEYRAQKAQLENGVVVLNHHGYWAADPLGNDESIRRMKRVAELVRTEAAPVIMCGDLNLKVEAPAMRELDFLRDLTAENEVKTTLRNLKFVGDVACDHILVSQDLGWSNFEVHQDILSDHLAVAVEIEV